jgi:hypothetical protein
MCWTRINSSATCFKRGKDTCHRKLVLAPFQKLHRIGSISVRKLREMKAFIWPAAGDAQTKRWRGEMDRHSVRKNNCGTDIQRCG